KAARPTVNCPPSCGRASVPPRRLTGWRLPGRRPPTWSACRRRPRGWRPLAAGGRRPSKCKSAGRGAGRAREGPRGTWAARGGRGGWGEALPADRAALRQRHADAVTAEGEVEHDLEARRTELKGIDSELEQQTRKREQFQSRQVALDGELKKQEVQRDHANQT